LIAATQACAQLARQQRPKRDTLELRGQGRAGLTGVRWQGQARQGRCPITPVARSTAKRGGSGVYPRTGAVGGSEGWDGTTSAR
jgi:hypothetical protein